MLKKRLIGALILIALAIIFLPMLFDGSGNLQPVQLDIKIPDKPQTETKQSDLDNEKIVDSEKVTEAEIEPSADKPTSGWIVQVASFSEQSNADALQEQLEKKGYTAFVATAEVNGRTWYRVRVGPEEERNNADKLQKKIARTENLNGTVMSY